MDDAATARVDPLYGEVRQLMEEATPDEQELSSDGEALAAGLLDGSTAGAGCRLGKSPMHHADGITPAPRRDSSPAVASLHFQSRLAAAFDGLGGSFAAPVAPARPGGARIGPAFANQAKGFALSEAAAAPVQLPEADSSDGGGGEEEDDDDDGEADAAFRDAVRRAVRAELAALVRSRDDDPDLASRVDRARASLDGIEAANAVAAELLTYRMPTTKRIDTAGNFFKLQRSEALEKQQAQQDSDHAAQGGGAFGGPKRRASFKMTAVGGIVRRPSAVAAPSASAEQSARSRRKLAPRAPTSSPRSTSSAVSGAGISSVSSASKASSQRASAASRRTSQRSSFDVFVGSWVPNASSLMAVASMASSAIAEWTGEA